MNDGIIEPSTALICSVGDVPTQQALPLPSAVTKPTIETVSHTQAEADVITTRTHSHSASDETITAGMWHVNIWSYFLNYWIFPINICFSVKH